MAEKFDPREIHRCPTPVNVDALLTRTRFDEPLLHYTPEQWKYTTADLEQVKRMSDKAVRMIAVQLPGDHGVVANPFVGCPPGCSPTGGRGIVCPDLGIHEGIPREIDPVGYTPHPDCWFEPQCWCDPEVGDIFGQGGRGGDGGPDCDDDNCRYGFQPIPIRLPDGTVITITRFGCRRISGDCERCRFVVERVDFGVYRLGCECVC